MSSGRAARCLMASAITMNSTKMMVMVKSASRNARSTSPVTYRCKMLRRPPQYCFLAAEVTALTGRRCRCRARPAVSVRRHGLAGCPQKALQGGR